MNEAMSMMLPAAFLVHKRPPCLANNSSKVPIPSLVWCLELTQGSCPIDSFHRYLKSSLTQAKVEHLVDADLLSSAEGDLMITGTSFVSHAICQSLS